MANPYLQVLRTPHALPMVLAAFIGRLPLSMVGLGCVLLVAGCREEEQDRPLVYGKGTYQGPADEKLEQAEIEALRQRAARQQM